MAENKTWPTAHDVSGFLDRVPDPQRREDAKALCRLIARETGEPPVLWGPSIIGFGSYHYRYASDHEGDAPIVGFSPRARELVLYLYCHGEWSDELLARLGKHRTGKACLYIRSLANVDEAVLIELIRGSAAQIRRRYRGSA
jgi:hypothetical protein